MCYEEIFLWYFEDVEGKVGVWVGFYVVGFLDSNVVFVIDGVCFCMIFLEWWYKFDEKLRFDIFLFDDVEKFMYEVKEVK